jgi:TonB family protein
MFGEIEGERGWFRRNRGVGISVCAHLVALAVIALHNPRVIDLAPNWLAHGDSDHTYRVTYFAPGDEKTTPDMAKLAPPSERAKPHRATQAKKTPSPPPPPQEVEANAEVGDQNSHAGSLLGTVLDGLIKGHEVRVALPVYPEPQVDRADLPRDLVGDVVIEVTIDAEGNVIETKIVQAIGHGIDEKIEATLRRRHYQPATLDGVPIASRQDVHFHFPS